MKKLISILVTLAVLVMGCGAFAATNEFCATPGGAYEDTVTVSTVRVLDASLTFDEGDDIENNRWTRFYLDEHNLAVSYAWTAPDAANYTEKVNLMLTTGELPDFLYLNATQYEQA